jgi:hypothetical protein
MERMKKWKGAVTQGYRYLGDVENEWLSTGGIAGNVCLLEIGTTP